MFVGVVVLRHPLHNSCVDNKVSQLSQICTLWTYRKKLFAACRTSAGKKFKLELSSRHRKGAIRKYLFKILCTLGSDAMTGPFQHL